MLYFDIFVCDLDLLLSTLMDIISDKRPILIAQN